VIDPGHGGKDPGAIGLGDLEEKEVTLAVAKQLQKELRKAMPGVKVVMTRDDDTFIELDRRGQIANESNGRLFVSIHCNSMPQKPHPVSGFECYILRPGKSEDAARVVATENASVRFENDRRKYEELEAEHAIVASMAQSTFARYSETVAQEIRESMRGSVGIPDRGVLQAGFYVLIGASMPGVLVEIGYLTSENDVAVMKNMAGRKKIARAISRGITSYAKIYSSSLR
jgi:N-acetylmuramoyl-L-alanine amidase